MLTGNLLLVFAMGGILALLTILQFFLAVRHDHVVSAAGPLQSLEALKTQIAHKRDLIADFDAELDKRRISLQDSAGFQAEAEATRAQRDNLLAEWATLQQKREEVRAVRADMEQALGEKLTVDSDLARGKAELEELRESLVRAEQLVARTEALNSEYGSLQQKVAELREETRLLEQSQERVAELESRARELETRTSQLDGNIASKSEQLEDAKAQLAAEREAVATGHEKKLQLVFDLAAVEQEIRVKGSDLTRLSDQRSALEARLAHLDDRIKEQESKVGGAAGAAGSEDPLRELKLVPPVLTNLKGWKPAELRTESDALHRVTARLDKSGLEFHPRVVRAFHTAMKVNETTQMAVLAGISGTGKSQLPRVYAEGMGIGFLQVPVQPRWDSPQDLMGFYNYIEGRYRPTDMAKALWQLDGLNNPESEFKDRMLLILLDEMNLARVEYYFSDFLSRLESRPLAGRAGEKNLRKDAEIELEIPTARGMEPPRIFPGYNLLFAGTMNEDESTQSLSDKVVDRANVLRFAAPKKIKSSVGQDKLQAPEALMRNHWKGWIKPLAAVENEHKVTDSISHMVKLMKDFNRPIGHRVGRAIMAYAANYPEAEGSNRLDEALADQVEMRLLPKLRGVDIETADGTFVDLQKFVADDLRDDALAEAIQQSVNSARNATGQFVWQGVTR